MKKKKLTGYIGRRWDLYWTDEDGKYNHYGKGTRKVTMFGNYTLPIYKTLKDGIFPCELGYPVKVCITIKEIE